MATISDEARQLLANQRILDKKLDALANELAVLKERFDELPARTPAPVVRAEPPKIQKVLLEDAMKTGVALGIGFAIANVLVVIFCVIAFVAIGVNLGGSS
jgi:hypothetical protein